MNTKAVFRTLNSAFLALTLFLATGFLMANYRAALANGVEDGVCPSEIHDPVKPCPAGSEPYATMAGWHCQQSSPYYTGGIFGMGQQGPYYNCCRYEGMMRICVIASRYGNKHFANGGDWYFRTRTLGDMSCGTQGETQGNCIDNAGPPAV